MGGVQKWTSNEAEEYCARSIVQSSGALAYSSSPCTCSSTLPPSISLFPSCSPSTKSEVFEAVSSNSLLTIGHFQFARLVPDPDTILRWIQFLFFPPLSLSGALPCWFACLLGFPLSQTRSVIRLIYKAQVDLGLLLHDILSRRTFHRLVACSDYQVRKPGWILQPTALKP